ncbi:MAG: ribonuclease P protein subunit [Candidatus Thalassarchaeaceae archaeon]|jgi:RNase P/RNase MRP subunit p29|nr:ribonuclease P protein subunit [Candidatus Thalassarchaeaceae archaeon]|tara:strand:- start:9844 stop:10107 length:264 start_codon:yes stop_codon:yes gene_type:complete
MMSPMNQPWLARTITVTRSKDEGLVGLKGMIVHETKRTLRVRSPKGVHVIAKDVISFTLDGSDLVIEGSEVLQKPEDRVSRRYRRNR